MSKKTYTGINIQWPISELILNGQKTIETRTYPIPEKYLNQEMLMIETPGKNGKFKSRIVAVIKFTKCFKYNNKKDFYNDSDKHFVIPGSEWAWRSEEKWGWSVVVINILKKPTLAPNKKGIKYTKNISI